MTTDRVFYLGNRPVRIQMLIDPNVFDNSGYKVSIIVFLIGMLLTMTVCAMVYLLVNRERRV